MKDYRKKNNVAFNRLHNALLRKNIDFYCNETLKFIMTNSKTT